MVNIIGGQNQLNKMNEERQSHMPERIQSSNQKNPEQQKSNANVNSKIVGQPQATRAANSRLFKIYYLNRQKVYNWIFKQSKRLKLQMQTLANTIFLADKYYMQQQLQPTLFKKIGLVLMIISTKSLQHYILYTQTIAENNKIPFQDLLSLQYNTLLRFGFKVSQHNYVRSANYYIEKWDRYQQYRSSSLYFLRDDIQSYVNYQKVLFLCYKFHLQFGNDLEVNIVFILKYVIVSSNNHLLNQLLSSQLEPRQLLSKRLISNQILSNQHLSEELKSCLQSFNYLSQLDFFEQIEEQLDHSCQLLSKKQEDLQAKYSLLRQNLVGQLSKQLEEIDSAARSKYSQERKGFNDYSVFINIPL